MNKPPLPAPAEQEPTSPAAGGGADLRVHPNKNRIVQVARTGGRKLFDKARREAFLEWFAATCNVLLSAEKAGVHYRTVYRHRMNDEAFAGAWDRALQQGYARVEARLLQEVGSPILPGTGRWRAEGVTEGVGSLHDAPSTIESSFDGPPPRPGEELQINGDLDEALVEEHFDPQLALQLLREHSRRRSADPAERRGKAGAAPRAASNSEVVEALVKRLKAFALRQGGQAPLPAPAAQESPSPARGEGQG